MKSCSDVSLGLKVGFVAMNFVYAMHLTKGVLAHPPLNGRCPGTHKISVVPTLKLNERLLVANPFKLLSWWRLVTTKVDYIYIYMCVHV